MSEEVQRSASGFRRRTVLQGFMAAGVAAALPWSSRAQETGPHVEAAAGKLVGSESDGIKIFKGVPYGAPTGGAQRFKPPRPAAPWTGIRQALAYGPASPQGASMDAPAEGMSAFLLGENISLSEDCLCLNVWTPGLDAAKRPVLVWLHGGGFSTGAGSAGLYDGTQLARTQDVVVVTVNHRLNVFGYLDLSEIGGAEYADSSLAGMLDIVLALRWVNENIERFGGDPGCVTVFGESGGGRKVSVLQAMPTAQGLFHRAIVQSGSALRMDTKEVATDRTQRLLAALEIRAGQLDRLLALPPQALLAAMGPVMQRTGQFRPTTGAPALPAHPFDPAAPSISRSVPMLIGTNLTEASFQMTRDPRVIELDEAGVLERVKRLVPQAQVSAVLAAYKKAYPGMAPSDWLFRIATDRGYFLDSTIQAERKAGQAAAPAFLYSFYWEQPLGESGRTHVPHGSEIAFVFNNVQLARGESPAQLASTMSAAWAAFARTGDPSTEALGKWTPYDATSRPTMIFDRQCRMENDPRGELRKLMAKFGSQQYASPVTNAT